MRIAMLSDIHGRASTPIGRIDDYPIKLYAKLNYMIDRLNNTNIDVLLLAGDILENVHVPITVITNMYKIFKKYKGTILFVYGNHDLQNHNYEKREDSPLSHLLEILPNMYELTAVPFRIGDVVIYGTSWNQEIPVPLPTDKYTILVIHKMVIHKKLWQGQKVTDTSKGSTLLKSHNYNLIVSGDNHQQFVLREKFKHKFLVNSGSMMRSTINQIDATPAFYIMDTNDFHGKPIKVHFPLGDDNAFDIDKLMLQKEQINNIDKFSTFIEVLAKNKINDKLSFDRIYNDLLIATNDSILIKESNDIFKNIDN